MPRIAQTKVTLTNVNSLKPGETIRDSEVKGFGARRQADSTVYFLRTSVKGRLRWLTIGMHGSPWTPTTARMEALRLKVAISGGDDPVEAREKERRELTFADVVERFKAEHVTKLKVRTAEAYIRLLDQFLVPHFGKRRMDDIDLDDVSDFHARHGKTPRQANTMIAVLSKVVNWAADRHWRTTTTNPCLKIKKYRQLPRERYLSEVELGRLGQALNDAETSREISPYAAAAIQLLLLIGARLSEILTLKWDYVHLDRGLILLPDSKTGAKPLTLNDAAIEVLMKIPRRASNPYVIVGMVEGSHIVNLQKPWRRVRAAAGLDDVRIHDLRHSFASVAASAGGSLLLIGKLLGHSQAQTTARYAHLADNPVRSLNREVGERIARSLKGKAGAPG